MATQPKERKAVEDFDELVAAVARQTKLEPAVVRQVLTSSFESTKAYVLREALKNVEKAWVQNIGSVQE